MRRQWPAELPGEAGVEFDGSEAFYPLSHVPRDPAHSYLFGELLPELVPLLGLSFLFAVVVCFGATPAGFTLAQGSSWGLG